MYLFHSMLLALSVPGRFVFGFVFLKDPPNCF